METQVLNKYFNSRLRGVLIRDIYVYPDGKVVINAENGDSKEYYVSPYIGYSNDIRDYDADYIICALQSDRELSIHK